MPDLPKSHTMRSREPLPETWTMETVVASSSPGTASKLGACRASPPGSHRSRIGVVGCV